MATAQQPQAAAGGAQLTGIAKTLLQRQVITEQQASSLSVQASVDKVSFLEALGKQDRQATRRAAAVLSELFGFPLLDLDAMNRDVMPADLFDVKAMAEHRAIPLFVRNQRLWLAISDPTMRDTSVHFGTKSNKRIEQVLVDDAQITAFLARLTQGESGAPVDLGLSDDDLNMELTDGEEVARQAAVDEATDEESEAPVVRFVKSILLTAIKKGASDIHFEPFEREMRVRMRIDGELKKIAVQPASSAARIVSRIKVISKLNIADKRVPQDGRMKMKLQGGRAIDFRVSTVPVLHGEKVVMRILDPSSARLGIDALGYEPEEKARLLEAIDRPYGMILVTGPTGSGKTVSLYTCLNLLNGEGRNISTAEDPAEIELPGVNQVSVNPQQGLTFASALKAFLRQDPDIIMVGEIRDEETAEISVKAAATGHLLLSTLHTNDAPKTIGRLMEIGVKPYNIASSVILITAQRLARRLCPHCKIRDDSWTATSLIDAGMTQEEAAEYGRGWVAYRQNPDGCDRCTGGYKGRVGVYQVMPITDEIRRLILDGGDAMLIAAQASAEGVRDLRQSALLKFRQGMTSMAEVLSVTNET